MEEVIRKCRECLFKNFPPEEVPCRGCTDMSSHFVDKNKSPNLDFWENVFAKEIAEYNMSSFLKSQRISQKRELTKKEKEDYIKKLDRYQKAAESVMSNYNKEEAEKLVKEYECLFDSAAFSVFSVFNNINNSEESKSDISHPSRYSKNGYECIDVMIAVFGVEATKHFCKLNAFKYIWRESDKGKEKDIQKAIQYLKWYLELSDSDKLHNNNLS